MSKRCNNLNLESNLDFFVADFFGCLQMGMIPDSRSQVCDSLVCRNPAIGGRIFSEVDILELSHLAWVVKGCDLELETGLQQQHITVKTAIFMVRTPYKLFDSLATRVTSRHSITYDHVLTRRRIDTCSINYNPSHIHNQTQHRRKHCKKLLRPRKRPNTDDNTVKRLNTDDNTVKSCYDLGRHPTQTTTLLKVATTSEETQYRLSFLLNTYVISLFSPSSARSAVTQSADQISGGKVGWEFTKPMPPTAYDVIEQQLIDDVIKYSYPARVQPNESI
ncbi:hypothetical protein J6590_017294 [Homalodisca vitripennis]|nr:hypothetical protein J6590_017294 [Homalodisca vitripennis]